MRFRNGNVYFVIGNDEILIPPRMKSTLAAYKNKDMVLGIRPEHLLSEPLAGQSENSIDCTAVVVEPLGDRMDVYLETVRGDRFIANVDPHVDIQMGQAVTIYLDAEKIKIFEQGELGNNATLTG